MNGTDLSKVQADIGKLNGQLHDSLGNIMETLHQAIDPQEFMRRLGLEQEDTSAKPLPLTRKERRAEERKRTHKRSRPAKSRPQER